MQPTFPFASVAADSVCGVGDVEQALRRAGKGYAGKRSVTAVADALGISRQLLSTMHNRPPPRLPRRPPLPDAELVADTRLLITDLLTYGYCRVHALLRCQARRKERAALNPKQVYPVMKVHACCSSPIAARATNGATTAASLSAGPTPAGAPTRWRSAATSEKVRVAFALDCCDREAVGHVATTGGITAKDVRDLMGATAEHRFGPVTRLAEPIEWLTDNGMAEAFVRTLKRDYVR